MTMDDHLSFGLPFWMKAIDGQKSLRLTLKFKSDTKLEKVLDETKNQRGKRTSQNHKKPQG